MFISPYLMERLTGKSLSDISEVDSFEAIFLQVIN